MSAKEKIVIAHVDVSERKRDIVRDVLADLPEWFGLPESTKLYVTEAAKLPLWAAYYHGHAIGFIDYLQTSVASGEINCMVLNFSVFGFQNVQN